ncbi:general transcription factor 3C polypeptide 6 [Euwallacea fornicatus]|uniref:general transcription factor 3C polypeptide 6 n=1 Tax=Euwallacea fornicatus TaxID=995702 RepID=UPI00338FE22D
MEINNTTEDDIEEQLIFLDFNDKLPSELLNNKIFLRVANLEEKNPLVQVNDLIFKGTYQHSLGTNLFFNETENYKPPEFPFKDSSQSKLAFMAMQRKELNCKQMKLPPTKIQMPATPGNINFNLDWDYKELLTRFENGTLDFDDMIKKEDECEHNAEVDLPSQNIESSQDSLIKGGSDDPMDVPKLSEEHPVHDIKNVEISDVHIEDQLLTSYNKLQVLAFTPVKQKIIQEHTSCDPQYQNAYDYHSIECKVLCRPWFSYRKTQLTQNIEDYVDIDRCVFLGLLLPSNNHPRKLTDEEKKEVLTIENFENLDLPARNAVLQAHKYELEKQIHSNTEEENKIIDEFGRTPLETLDVYEKLLTALRLRIENIDFK